MNLIFEQILLKDDYLCMLWNFRITVFQLLFPDHFQISLISKTDLKLLYNSE